MNIGILQIAYKKAEDYGLYYNVQELGLARALASKGHNVTLYKGVDGEAREYGECQGKLSVKLISLKYLGINGLFDPRVMDSTIDVLIFFCDTQIRVPQVYSWCKENNVSFYPYVGVIESHSENLIKRLLMRYIAKRNISVYKKCHVLAKTPDIKNTLEELGCNDTALFPVGLDESVMKSKKNAEIAPSNAHTCVEKLLFVGRMEEEKQPLEMVRIYKELLRINHRLELTMIGDGYMYREVEEALDKLKSEFRLDENQITLIRKVKYQDMADYYINSSCYINLNKVEILGMSILEAMYYGCPVFVIDAPGPRYIMGEDDNLCRYIGLDVDGLIELLKNVLTDDREMLNVEQNVSNAYKRVKTNFTWNALVNNFNLE